MFRKCRCSEDTCIMKAPEPRCCPAWHRALCRGAGEGIQAAFTQDGGLVTGSQTGPGFSPSRNSYVGIHCPCPKNETQPCCKCVCCVCMLLSCVGLFATLWTYNTPCCKCVLCVCVAQLCRILCDSMDLQHSMLEVCVVCVYVSCSVVLDSF